MGIHYIYWFGFVQIIHPPKSFHTCRCHTCKDIASEISNPHWGLLGISSLFPSLVNPHGDFFSQWGSIPFRENKSYHISNLGKKSLWEVKPYIMENIGINSPYQISIGLLVLILYREVDYSHSYSQCYYISEKNST